MHNALFPGHRARVGILRFIAPDQSTIAALNGHRIAYLTEGIAEIAPARFRADPERLRRFADAPINQP